MPDTSAITTPARDWPSVKKSNASPPTWRAGTTRPTTCQVPTASGREGNRLIWMPRAVSSSRSSCFWRCSIWRFSSASILSRACSITLAELAATIDSNWVSSRVQARPGSAVVTASMPVKRLPALSGTASTERMREATSRSAGNRGSFGRSGEASASPRAIRNPMTFLEIACGHDPD